MDCSFSRQCFIKGFLIMQVHRDTLFLRRSRGQKEVWIMKNSFLGMKPHLFLQHPVIFFNLGVTFLSFWGHFSSLRHSMLHHCCHFKLHSSTDISRMESVRAYRPYTWSCWPFACRVNTVHTNSVW